MVVSWRKSWHPWNIGRLARRLVGCEVVKYGNSLIAVVCLAELLSDLAGFRWIRWYYQVTRFILIDPIRNLYHLYLVYFKHSAGTCLCYSWFVIQLSYLFLEGRWRRELFGMIVPHLTVMTPLTFNSEYEKHFRWIGFLYSLLIYCSPNQSYLFKLPNYERLFTL